MPISPDEARRQREKVVDPEAYMRVTGAIDRYLAEERPVIGAWYYNISGMSEILVKRLVEVYRTTGWIVVRGTGRDAIYLIFDDRPPPSAE